MSIKVKRTCKICRSDDIEVIYDDYIRDGGIGNFTKDKYKMYQCKNCKTIWHDIDNKSEQYYKSSDYRNSLEKSSDIKEYYSLHDREVLEKLQYTGTEIYRNNIVADIGCGGGSFLDFLSGAADEIIAIEPSAKYRVSLAEKGYKTYAYAKEAYDEFFGKVGVITSFDVIEHVDSPSDFIKEVYELLKTGGKAIVGTPTDCPVMRELLGNVYEQELLYSYQHPWILSKDSFELICKEAGFKNIKISYVQRYGLSNMISWLIKKQPMGHVKYDFVTKTLDAVYRTEFEKQEVADYIIAYLEK